MLRNQLLQCRIRGTASVKKTLHAATQAAMKAPAASGRQPMRPSSAMDTLRPTAAMPQIRHRSETACPAFTS